ncbi:MAG: cytochrome b [Thiofilum sp.]|uniref:cytochrome b n=1 Tax=Thiofilum sp. TaxID=2212733 RepID=UPI0025DE4898|nr:cytochrome b [Thiofilum sp.]MBK8454003.1 cytochrome b [Thiofilum sp.]
MINTQRYSTLSISMHWVMLLLMAAVYLCIELRVIYPKGTDPREALKMWHFMLGLAVFVLVWIRLLARMFGNTPTISPTPAAWQLLLSKVIHLALYAFMLGMPILGWLVLSASGKPVPFFGLELPALIGTNEELAKELKEIHEIIGTVGYWLIGLHAVGALAHHYVFKDNTLMRMLPSRA